MREREREEFTCFDALRCVQADDDQNLSKQTIAFSLKSSILMGMRLGTETLSNEPGLSEPSTPVSGNVLPRFTEHAAALLSLGRAAERKIWPPTR